MIGAPHSPEVQQAINEAVRAAYLGLARQILADSPLLDPRDSPLVVLAKREEGAVRRRIADDLLAKRMLIQVP